MTHVGRGAEHLVCLPRGRVHEHVLLFRCAMIITLRSVNSRLLQRRRFFLLHFTDCIQEGRPGAHAHRRRMLDVALATLAHVRLPVLRVRRRLLLPARSSLLLLRLAPLLGDRHSRRRDQHKSGSVSTSLIYNFVYEFHWAAKLASDGDLFRNKMTRNCLKAK